TVDVVQIGELVRKKRTAAGFLGELPQDELGFLEALRAGRRSLAGAQPDRVDRRFGSLREIEHFLEGQQARRILAVRQQHDRLTSNLLDVVVVDFLKVLHRDVYRVV